MTPPKYLIVPEAARLLRVSPATVYRWIERGVLPHSRAGRRVLFDEAQLIEWVRAWRKEAR
jgi:excisionase family DNA binding protein